MCEEEGTIRLSGILCRRELRTIVLVHFLAPKAHHRRGQTRFLSRSLHVGDRPRVCTIAGVHGVAARSAGNDEEGWAIAAEGGIVWCGSVVQGISAIREAETPHKKFAASRVASIETGEIESDEKGMGNGYGGQFRYEDEAPGGLVSDSLS